MRLKIVFLMVVISVVLAACFDGASQESEQPNHNEDGEPAITDGYEVVATGLQIPWSIAYDGQNFYISEREGTIAKIKNGKITREQVFLKMPLADRAEAGLLGFVLQPNKPNTAIAYYTYESGNRIFNRVVELRKESDGWHEENVLVDQIPSGNVHHGGRIKIGPDGKLYITIGDAANPNIAQDLNSLGGKILRINLDGTIPSDNPFQDSPIYSYGHRNPQGLVWSEDGTLFSSEHGQSAHDEINVIKPGANYGWPVIQGDETNEGMETPLFHSGTTTWAPSGLSFADGILYAAQLRGEGVLAFNIQNKTYEQIISNFGRIRDVFIFDGDLYFITNNTDGRGTPRPEDDKLIKISLKRGL